MGGSAVPLKLEAWVPQQMLVQGEPVVLHYRLTNLAKEDLLVELWGPGRFPIWLAGSTIQSSGRVPVPLAPGITPVDYGGGIDQPGVRLQAGQQYEGREVLARWTPTLDPGPVDLRLIMQVPAEPIGTEAGVSDLLRGQEDLSLVILERDPARLRALALDLQRTLKTGLEVAEDADLDLLLALPAEEAGEVWRSLAKDHTLDSTLHDMLVKLLGQHDSVLAADILAGLAWDLAAEPKLPEGSAARHARDNLLNLYRKANPVVQERVRQQFLAREGAVPSQSVNGDSQGD